MMNKLKKWVSEKAGIEDAKRACAYALSKTLGLNDYQRRAHQTSLAINTFLLTPNQVYAGLGLGNEGGEVGGLIKKALRGDYGDDPANCLHFKQKLQAEIGDCLWYIAELSRQFDMDLEDVAFGNIRKLKSRQARGVLRGSGGER